MRRSMIRNIQCVDYFTLTGMHKTIEAEDHNDNLGASFDCGVVTVFELDVAHTTPPPNLGTVGHKYTIHRPIVTIPADSVFIKYKSDAEDVQI